MRISLFPMFSLKNLTKLITVPFCLALFLYFFTASADLISIRFVFTFKVGILAGLIAFALHCLITDKILIDKEFFQVAVFCFLSMIASLIPSLSPLPCLGFLFYFIFNYFVFFVVPYSLFRFMDDRLVFWLYSLGFICVGSLTVSQVLMSIVGITPPFAGQFFAGVYRGQGFSYEPSYYALYMTPYTMFYTMRFLLQEKKDKKWSHLIVPNLFFVASTSAGCLASYIVLACCIVGWKWKGIIKTNLKKLFIRAFLVSGLIVCVLLLINPVLITQGFLKFFYVGLTQHHSFAERWNMIGEYWQVFLENPILGTGLGGGPTYLYYKHTGTLVDFKDLFEISAFMPTNVSMELLSGLGILGASAFIWFLISVRRVFQRIFSMNQLGHEERINVISLATSLIVLFVACQMNQSIMRSYIWIHTGICVGYVKYLYHKAIDRSFIGNSSYRENRSIPL